VVRGPASPPPPPPPSYPSTLAAREPPSPFEQLGSDPTPSHLLTQELLLALAGAAGLEAKKAALFAGEKINTTEGRAALHPALRAPKGRTMCIDGVDQVAPVHAVLDAIAAFSARVRGGEWVGCTGKPLTAVVAVGIGGSYLGPEFVYEALSTDPAAAANAAGRTLKATPIPPPSSGPNLVPFPCRAATLANSGAPKGAPSDDALPRQPPCTPPTRDSVWRMWTRWISNGQREGSMPRPRSSSSSPKPSPPRRPCSTPAR
jgi:hypothetical protein